MAPSTECKCSINVSDTDRQTSSLTVPVSLRRRGLIKYNNVGDWDDEAHMSAICRACSEPMKHHEQYYLLVEDRQARCLTWRLPLSSRRRHVVIDSPRTVSVPETRRVPRCWRTAGHTASEPTPAPQPWHFHRRYKHLATISQPQQLQRVQTMGHFNFWLSISLSLLQS